jgi:hypothetical protein
MFGGFNSLMAAPFNPLSLNPAVWFSDTGGNAAQWPDLSGNNRNATQSTPDNMPAIIVNGLNGRQVRRFDGVNDSLSTAIFGSSINQPVTCFAVFSSSNTTNQQIVCAGAGVDSRNLIVQRSSVGAVTGINMGTGYFPIESRTGFQLICTIANGTQSLVVRNGGVEFIGDAGINGIDRIILGRSGSGSSFLAGDIAEVIVLPYAANAAQRRAVERYLFQKWFGVDDPDAGAYIARVEAADGQQLEPEVKVAINTFVTGCKSDGIWNAIKASCILSGARTLNGALQPLVGAAPTNVSFLAADYNRKTGLLGNGTTKFINSNRNNNTDPQNSHHMATWVTQADTTSSGNPGLIGTGGSATGESAIGYNIATSNYFLRSRSSTTLEGSAASRATGFHAISRTSSTNVNTILPGFVSSVTLTSQTPRSSTIKVLGRDVTPYWNGRVSFYSIGESLDLTLLNARVSQLMTSLNNVIP